MIISTASLAIRFAPYERFLDSVASLGSEEPGGLIESTAGNWQYALAEQLNEMNGRRHASSVIVWASSDSDHTGLATSTAVAVTAWAFDLYRFGVGSKILALVVAIPAQLAVPDQGSNP
jgi:hypothetical protein